MPSHLETERSSSRAGRRGSLTLISFFLVKQSTVTRIGVGVSGGVQWQRGIFRVFWVPIRYKLSALIRSQSRVTKNRCHPPDL